MLPWEVFQENNICESYKVITIEDGGETRDS